MAHQRIAHEPCATWPARAAHPYAGPWNRPTASPILVVNPTFDPATPYQAAKAMVRELANARLLTLEGSGHTALINPGACINRHVVRYLIKGTLPPVGATCAQDPPPLRDAQTLTRAYTPGHGPFLGRSCVELFKYREAV